MLRRRVRRYDPEKKLTFVAGQAEDLEERTFYLVTKEQAMKSVYAIDSQNRIYKGARAIGETMKQLSQPWKFFGYLLAFPPIAFLAQPFYLFVAWQRTRISRLLTNESCGQFFSQKAEDWLDQQEEANRSES